MLVEPIQNARSFQIEKVKVKVPPKPPAFHLPPQSNKSQQRFRVSVRLAEWSTHRYMVMLDLDEFTNVKEFIKHLYKVFSVEHVKDADYILVLEPDILVSELETLSANDHLLITTLQKFQQIEEACSQLEQQYYC
jgi:hypothetical protein